MFKLCRYYSLASLVGVIVVITVLSFYMRYLATQSLLDQQTRTNVDITKSFANSLWHRFSGFVEISSKLSVDALKKRPEIRALHAVTTKQMKDTNVVKVKVYNLAGLTVFSTDEKQIGSDKSTNEGFLRARNGKVASEITFRQEIYAFEKIIMDRNLVATYIPVYNKTGNAVNAVFEVYTDVTPLVKGLETTHYRIIAGIFTALATLYLFLFLIVKRADNIIVRNEKERKQIEKEIWHHAYHDSLTGLPNRNSFNERFEEVIARAKRYNRHGALMFLDLDRFKLINDSLGHDAGDMLLQSAATRLSYCVRETDMVFRLSGDEFVIILEDLEEVEDAALTAQRMLDSMVAPVSLNGYEVIMNMSIGITTFPKKGMTAASLLKEADAAMYRAKELRGNRFEFFNYEMNTVALSRLSMETGLQRALDNNEYVLYYQTKIDTETRQIIGVEALLRWDNADIGLVLPNVFIPLLEEIGIVDKVGDWVIYTACLQMKQWIDAGMDPMLVSVNVSAKQFRNWNFASSVAAALEKTGLDPGYLELELTESMLVDDIDQAIEIMNQLKELGVMLSIDDFGSGYSSLSYLKRLPVDYLKIDRSFVTDMEKNHSDLAIISAITEVASSLGIKVVVEGVENEQQFGLLKEKGCHIMQGYLFSRPVNSETFERLVVKSRQYMRG